MRSTRQGTAIALALAMVVGRVSALHAAEAADSTGVTPVAQGPSWSFEGTGSWHNVEHPYFGTADSRDDWGEGFSRLRLNYGLPDGLWGSVATAGSTSPKRERRISAARASTWSWAGRTWCSAMGS